MGTIVKASCTNCEFEQGFYFGAGMMNFKTICNVPAIDKKTGEFVIRNILEREKYQTEYLFYCDQGMHLGKTSQNDLQWGEIWIKRTENFCPVCKKFTLRFEETGCFD